MCVSCFLLSGLWRIADWCKCNNKADDVYQSIYVDSQVLQTNIWNTGAIARACEKKYRFFFGLVYGFNNISVISWQPVLLVEETGVPRENHRPVASHWQTLSDYVVASIPRHEWGSNSQL